MAALAALLRHRGHEVSGCDIKKTARTDWLESLGIEVLTGHDPSHVADADEVIVTPAVRADNPEYLAAASKARFRGEVLAEIVNSTPDTVVVCGSHGKTTTSTWIARLLIALGEKVEWAIGGECGAFPVGGRTAEGAVLVVEADESDGTLAKYRAKTLLVTNCEYDHPDHFKTPAEYFACYEKAKSNAVAVIESEALEAIEIEVLSHLPAHNRKNARAAVEVALRRGHLLSDIEKALPSIVAELPDRRFQLVWPRPGVADGRGFSVVTDYAHHPTELKCAISMARTLCASGGKLRVLYQPHRYSRTKSLLGSFASAFDGADELVLCPTYAAFERPVEGGGICDLYKTVRESSSFCGTVKLARTCAEAWEHAYNSSCRGDAVLLLGAGDIVDLVETALADLGSGVVYPVKRVPIGQGTNTCKSDLKLSVEYFKVPGPAGRPGAVLLGDPEIAPQIPWMAGIPGTIGGWVKMNAGAFGHSISEIVEAVKIDGLWVDAADCGFGYRKSAIDGVIEDVRFRKCPPSDASAAQSAFLERRCRFPAGTKGSVFKNPDGDFAGRLLEAAGVRGMRVGGAAVWEKHANVIVLEDGGSASDFLALAQMMRERAYFRTGIELEYEVRGLEQRD